MTNETMKTENTAQLGQLAGEVLEQAGLDPDFREEILNPRPLREVCQAPCVKAFTDRIYKAARQKEKVMIAGDYDCDGIMATTILRRGLRKLGLEPGYYIPNRIKEGYGLSANTVSLAHEKGYSLIITVDNGVAAKEALAKAKELGVEVIVTDHHLIQEEPDASLVIHPTRMGDDFVDLCGAGIAYELTRALDVDDQNLLIYAAVASISDCMTVRRETRSIIQQGLRAFNMTREPHLAPFVRSFPVNETDVAFQIAPRINAIGRLADRANANTFVRYLEEGSLPKINRYAQQVDDLNTQRKDLTASSFARALVEVNPLSSVIFVCDPSFHEGIVGLIAGQLCSKTGKPAIVCTEVDGIIKGSMRAPAGFHCVEFLSGFDRLLSLGGHERAAGLSLSVEDKDAFKRFVRVEGGAVEYVPVEESRIEIEPQEVTVENVQSLDVLRPFGTGFELPHFELDRPTIFSSFDLSEGQHRKFTLAGGLQAVHFNQTSVDQAAPVSSIEKLIGTLSLSTWGGKRKADFLVDEIVYGN